MVADVRRPLRLLPLLLLLLLGTMTSPVSSTGADSHHEYSVCNTRCCTVEPNCSAALHVTCRCDDEPRVILRRGDFPASVESIEIYGVRRLRIYEHALLNLTSLAKVELHRVDKLTVYPYGLQLREDARLFTLTMDTVKRLKLESSAFSGFWERGTRIKIGYVTKLYIREDAFNFRSFTRSTGLIIERAKYLDMSSKAFNAPFQYVILASINARLCRRNTFGESIRRIEMSGLQVKEVREGCISGTGNLKFLSMSKCNLGIVRHRGVHGEICNMKIYHTNVSMIQPNGFHIHVHNLTITKSFLKTVMARGLNVLANNSIHLSEVNIRSLHKHALISLIARRNQTNNSTPISIDKLTVSHAEQGSLIFDKSADIRFRRLSIQAPEPAVCPMERWVRQLTGTGESDPLSPREQRILAMIQRDWLCPEDHHAAPGAPSDGDIRDPRDASDGGDPTNGDGRSGQAADQDDVIITVAVAVVLIMPIAGIVFTWYRSRNKRARSHQTKSSRYDPSNKSSERDVERSGLQTDGVRRRFPSPAQARQA